MSKKNIIKCTEDQYRAAVKTESNGKIYYQIDLDFECISLTKKQLDVLIPKHSTLKAICEDPQVATKPKILKPMLLKFYGSEKYSEVRKSFVTVVKTPTEVNITLKELVVAVKANMTLKDIAEHFKCTTKEVKSHLMKFFNTQQIGGAREFCENFK